MMEGQGKSIIAPTFSERGYKYGVLRHSGASNSEVNSLIWPEFELISDVMPVLVTCKFDEDLIKSKGAILLTTFSPL